MSDDSFIVNFLFCLGFSLLGISLVSLFFSDVGLIALLLKVLFVTSIILAFIFMDGDDDG